MHIDRWIYKINIALLILGIFFIPSPSLSETYYVDATNGSDSNSGTSPSSPWRYSPGMQGWSGSTKLYARDVVYFDSADTWKVAGGSSLITLFGGVIYDGQSWGSGTNAKLEATGSLSRGVVYFNNDDATRETVLRGFEVDGNDYNMHAGVNICVSAGRNCTGATKRVENCIVHNIDHADAGYGIKVGANNNYDTENVEIINNVVYTTGNDVIALYEQYGGNANSQIRNVLVRGNEMYDGNDNAHGLIVKNNVNGAIIEFNYSHDNENRGFNTHCDPGTPGPTNITFRYNIAYNNGKGGINHANNQTNGTRVIYMYGNLLFENNDMGSGGTGIYLESNLSNTIAYIYNNTIFNNANGEIWINDSNVSAEIKNNILSSLSGKIPLVAMSETISAHNNNLYYRSSGTIVSYGGSSYNASSLSNFEPSAYSSKPGFKNSSDPPLGFIGTYGIDLQPESDGLSIVSGKALNNGANLGGDPFNGAINLSGISGNANRFDFGEPGWDIGAYEYGEISDPGNSDLAAPKNLRII
jgi:hypothetical protein